jgi:hypothetical protein
MFVVSITYDSDTNPGLARTFENKEDAQLFALFVLNNSAYKEKPSVSIDVV